MKIACIAYTNRPKELAMYPIRPVAIGQIIMVNHPLNVSETFNKEEQQEVIKRTNLLGIAGIVDPATGEIGANRNISDIKSTIENAMWNKAKGIKKHPLKVTSKDVEKAIDLLELFCLYSQARLETAPEDPVVPKDKIYDRATKSLLGLEKIRNTLSQPKSKKMSKIPLKTSIRSLDKIWMSMTTTEQMALSTKIQAAEKILKRYCS